MVDNKNNTGNHFLKQKELIASYDRLVIDNGWASIWLPGLDNPNREALFTALAKRLTPSPKQVAEHVRSMQNLYSTNIKKSAKVAQQAILNYVKK